MVTQATPTGDDLAGTWEGAEAPEPKETPAPTAPEAEAPPDTANEQPTAPDLEAEIAKLRKENNDLRSQQGQRNARQRDAILQENADRIGAIEKVLDRLSTRLVKGDEDAGFETDLQTIRTERQQTAAERRWDATYQELTEALNEAIHDEDGNSVLTAQSPELAEARERWNAARKDKDEAGLNAAIRLTLKARIAAERKRAQAVPKEEPKKAPSPSMAVTPSGGAAAQSDQEIYKAYGRGEITWSKRVQEVKANLGL